MRYFQLALFSKWSTIEVDSQEDQFDYNQGADFVLLKLALTFADLPEKRNQVFLVQIGID
jgi:delta-aminolevulinic acid dehydratase/porphobilinogen synthase